MNVHQTTVDQTVVAVKTMEIQSASVYQALKEILRDHLAKFQTTLVNLRLVVQTHNAQLPMMVDLSAHVCSVTLTVQTL
jgi:hypothetical protein